MDRGQKETFVAELRERMDRAPVMYLTDFTGLSVKAMTRLRRSLKDSGAEMVVVKNRLAQRVFTEVGDLPDVSGGLQGPTGLVFGYDDAVAAAKVLSDFAKQNEDRPVFKIGIMDRKILAPEQMKKLANLPSRDQLLSELAGVMQAPIAALAAALEAKVQEMAGLLEALKAEREKSS
jgi:large subunit ribosomal protein L10